jgi:hypothetical protein
MDIARGDTKAPTFVGDSGLLGYIGKSPNVIIVDSIAPGGFLACESPDG